ncbi:DUF421 domain-containing protein [Paenibacillus turpanensis]|uniref:DUF421 domain-containing protein n=1 Tax=Paenibacillus turpanensis TaxID=2689078 RepID=UPI00140AF3AB|nr:DUF421 domain-containing protein [Paenibacillus turpanensis]
MVTLKVTEPKEVFPIDWFEVTIRSAAAFGILFLWARILGKKLIAQMTFFEFIAGVALGSVGANIMFNVSINVALGALGLSVFGILAFSADLVALKSFRGRKLLDSEPTLLIRNGEILEDGMNKVRMTMDELQMMLRQKNVFYFDQVELAYFETNGTVSVLKKPEYMPVTPKDINLAPLHRGQPQTVVIDGKVLANSLKALGKDEAWLRKMLRQKGITDVSEVMFAQVDLLDQLYIDKRNDHETVVH